MTDSNKKPASATPGKPAGRTTTGPAKSPKVAAQRTTKPSKPAKSVKGAKPGKAGGKPAPKPKRNAPGGAGQVRPEAAPVVELSPAKRALAWTHTARFLTTASQLHHLPVNGVLPSAQDELDDLPDQVEGDVDAEAEGDVMPARQLPEIAFVGRSNAGKSTAINTLAQQKRLAFASKTPGRTQHINVFVLGPKDAPDAIFSDLPGYGYAAVARDAKLRWQRVMADYLSERESLSGVVLMVDSRHGLTDLDKQLLEFVSDRVTAGEVSLLVLLTKADKLNRKEGAAALAKVQQELGVLATEDSDIAITLFSALNKQGLDDAAELLYEWAHREPRVLRGDEEGDEADEADAPDEDADFDEDATE